MKIVEIHRWADVALVLVVAESNDPTAEREGAAFLFDGEPPNVWSADAIMKNWALRLNARYVMAATAERLTLAHVDKLEVWVLQTHATARDVRPIYGDQVADELDRAADAVADAIAWPARRITNPPRDPAGVADLLFNADLWAFDQVRDVMEKCLSPSRRRDLPRRTAGRAKLLHHATDRLLDAAVPTPGAEAWNMRVRRLAARLRAGEADNLVRDVLRACRIGLYDRDGHEIRIS